LGDIIVKGLGLRNDQYEASMREIYERVFLSERERERGFSLAESQHLVFLFLCFWHQFDESKHTCINNKRRRLR
jgi:hypothetical protein